MKIDAVKLAETRLIQGLTWGGDPRAEKMAAIMLRLGGIEKVTGRTGEDLVGEFTSIARAIATGRAAEVPAWVGVAGLSLDVIVGRAAALAA
jgi:hypothetical protein